MATYISASSTMSSLSRRDRSLGEMQLDRRLREALQTCRGLERQQRSERGQGTAQAIHLINRPAASRGVLLEVSGDTL